MRDSRFPRIFGWTLIVSAALALAACAPSPTASGTPGGTAGGGGASLSGSFNIDGSSTVFPIASGLVEQFRAANPKVNVTANQAGTGSGMQKFARKEIEIATASRPIKAAEMEAATAAGVEFVEVPIAFDGLCIVVHPSNTWLKEITLEQLAKIWDKDSKVKMWNEVDPSWPAQPINLHGPTTDHGTYEFFNEVVNKDAKNSRQDYNQVPDYSQLVTNVSGDPSALGYVGFAYYESNNTKMRAVPVVGPNGPVTPSVESIADGTYVPFSRPLFLYVSTEALARPEVAAFLEMALGPDGSAVVETVDYIPLPESALAAVRAHVEAKKTGSAFSDAQAGMKIEEALKRLK